MKKEMCILPVRCAKCNGVFDLWYVLQEQEHFGGTVVENQRVGRWLNQSLCKHCKDSLPGNNQGDSGFVLEFE